jgi:hypothetical protein
MGHLPSQSSYRSDPEKGTTMTQLAKVFELNRQGLNIARGIAIAVVLLLPLVVLGLIHQDQYWLSVSFGAMFVGLSDPGGEYAHRVPPMALTGVAGALLTALGFGVGGQAWGFVVLVAFVVTLLGGLAVKFGVHRFAQATLLNVWFIIAITLPDAYRADHIHPNAWAQALAWLIGSALWIAFTCIVWLARGRTAEPSPVPEIPGDTSPVKLTRPIILFALIRAVALAGAGAIAFGLHVPNADWMPLATIVAMKPSLQQSTLVGEQRVAGTIIGAAVATLFLLTVHNKYGLEVVIVVLAVVAASIRGVNYAWYCAASAGAVLIALDLPHPSNLADEGRRVLFTFVGVGIAIVVLLLAGLLAKRAAKTAPQSPQASPA